MLALNDKFCLASDSLPIPLQKVLGSGYQNGAFLLPYPLRRHYFLATAFGVRRSLYYIQRDDNTNVGLNGGVVPIARGSPSPVRNASTGAEGTFRLHKLKKELVTLSREHVIGHSTLFFNQHAGRKAGLEIRFLGEKGTGSGVTREFYSVLANALQSRQGSKCSIATDKQSFLSLVPCELTVTAGYMDATHSGSISTQFSGFPTVAATSNLKLRKGQWYYEVEITKNGLAQIGFASSAYEGGDSEKGDGVGDDEHSWAFDGTRVLKWHKGANNKYGREWKVGDVVGCCIDMDLRSIKFSLNGSFDSPMGIAFDNIDADIEYMYPAITINSSFGGIVCFGGGMHGSTKYDPPLGYRCIFEAYDLPALDGHADSYHGEQTISSNARNEFSLWVDDSAQDGDYVMNTVGLFPAPLPIGHVATDIVCQRFQLIGTLVGRALMDEEMLPLPLSHDFIRLILGESVAIDNLSQIFVDSPTRGKLIRDLLRISQEDDVGIFDSMKGDAIDDHEEERKANKSSIIAPKKKHEKLQRQLSAELYMEDMVTGMPLIENGNDILVDETNYTQYISKMHNFLCSDGVKKQVEAFKEGLNAVDKNILSKLKMFSPEEIRHLICGSEVIDWTEDEIFECINAEHGYQKDSKEIHDLVKVLCNFDQNERKSFLAFLTGCPNLPAGGLKFLSPQICIYKKKPSDEVAHVDDALTSSRTCRNQLHLPPYSNIEIMKTKLKQSMEGSLAAIDLA